MCSNVTCHSSYY